MGEERSAAHHVVSGGSALPSWMSLVARSWCAAQSRPEPMMSRLKTPRRTSVFSCSSDSFSSVLQQPDTVYSSQTQPTAARHSLQQPDTAYSSQTQPTAARHRLQQPDTAYSSQTPSTAARHRVEQPDTAYSSYCLYHLLTTSLCRSR